MKALLSLRKYLSLLPQLEGIVHDAYAIWRAIQAGELDEPATEAAAADLGRRLLKLVGWAESHGAGA